MTEKMQIYKCSICGNIVEILHEGAGELVCCGEAMELLKEHNEDIGYEHHIPIVEIRDDKMLVKVGKSEHPSEEKHYIEFIEVHSPDGKYVKRKYLKAGEKPELEMKPKYNEITMRAYCNVHGLWRGHYAER
ncbi:desulfoferrodoxin [bacterium]|jgi:superoxide reductase|nr:desulfoferrodoxin [bacterium]